MELKMLTSGDYEQIKHVWSVCFGDSDAFIDTYFKYAASPCNGRAYVDGGGNILSDMFGLDFDVSVSGVMYGTKFLAGCATMPEARHKDLMKNLVRGALADYKSGGCAVATLHPFLHSFYRKFGFETIAYVENMETFGRNSGEAVIAGQMDGLPFESLHEAYEIYVSSYDNYFSRGKERFSTWLRLLFADGGKAAYLEGPSQTPYILYFEYEGHAEVFEAVYFNEGELEKMLGALPEKKVKYFLPQKPNIPKTAEFTMLRVLDPVTVLENYRFAEPVDFVVEIIDEFLGESYRLRVVSDVQGKNAVGHAGEHPAFTLDIGLFSSLVAGAGSKGEYPALEEIFPLKTSCFFETY